ncbi:Zn-dependent M28 family amino/carboxypeptidase [Halorubrum alkaliphilum]|uniref:Carboxypeptidase Q n=1 Tax=Halorubrum alkaliphilum TaxID=261290 RepID=A0A8T4GB67_9EURY|nr:M28 family metallopeptidase [Halorubrum alkaliphilum]MBP1921678.1 Zn-dependent M28 family amino/carboxypeptidase [Halorubrum alkaliphilum]
MTEWIGDTFTSDVGWNHLEALADVGNRMAGSDGERAGLELTRDAFAAVGARNARIEAFEIQGWERGDSAVSRDGDTLAAGDGSCIALPRSPDATATGELVDVGYGTPEEFESAAAEIEDSIVVVSTTVPDEFDRFVHRREKYYRAVDAGAAGFVFANHVEGGLPPTGSIGSETEPIGAIPAVGVSKEAGARLTRRYEGEEVTVDIDCATPDATSGTAFAELGPDTDEYLLVSSHVDAHDIAEGAMDNGAGTATIVEVARALADREGELETRVRFAAFGAEEVGLVGSSKTADGVDPGAVGAVVNVDSNVFGRTLKLDHHGFDELEAAGERLRERFDHPVALGGEIVPHSDHWPFVQRGIPGYMVSGETEDRGRGWGHTAADTLDKLDVRNLREQSILLTALVVDLGREGVSVDRGDTDRIAAELESTGAATGMKLTGDWPFRSK